MYTYIYTYIYIYIYGARDLVETEGGGGAASTAGEAWKKAPPRPRLPTSRTFRARIVRVPQGMGSRQTSNSTLQARVSKIGGWGLAVVASAL